MKLRPRALLPCVLFACLGGALRAQQAPPPDAPRRDLRRAVEAVRDSSALIGYIIGTPRTVDEALAVAAQAKAVADADSRHPGIVALPDTADADLRRRLFEAAATRAFLITPRFLGAGDAPGDLALGPANEGLLLLEYVSSCCEMAGKAPVWAALDVAGDGEGWRSASVEEIRLATWVSLAGGAKGVLLGPYSALVDEHLKALDSRAPEIRQLGGAVRELTAALLDIAPTDAFAEGPEGIILRCFMDHQGRPILIVVNTNVAAPARPVIELDATALGHPWEAQDIVSRLALPARGEGDVRRIAPPLPAGGGAALIVRTDKSLKSSAHPPDRPFGDTIPFGVWFTPGSERDSEGQASPYRRVFDNMVRELGVNTVLANDTPFGELDALLNAAEREDIHVAVELEESH